MNIFIMSGVPGSGKSYEACRVAGQMCEDGEKGVIVSADHFWHKKCLVEALGEKVYKGLPFDRMMESDVQTALDPTNYSFVSEWINKAHHECFRAFVINAILCVPTIIVDNTNIWAAEIAPYVLAGEAYNYDVEIIRIETDLETCLGRNDHKVPEDIVRRMNYVFNARTHQGHLREHMPWWKVIRK